MKQLVMAALLFVTCKIAIAQSVSFNDDTDVLTYMEGKVFYNSNNGLEIQYGYIPSGNTYGITVKNKYGNVFRFINVEVTTYGSFADLYGMSLQDGGTFGFRLYRGKLVVGEGEAGAITYYLKN